MAKKSNICSSVEGEKLHFNTRQFYPKPPIFHEQLGHKVHPFKLGINGYVEIVSSLERPKEMAVYESSMVAKGDSIQGGSIDGWSSRPIKKPSVQSGATGTHSASFGDAKGHSYAHVQSSQRDHLQSADIRDRHPDVVLLVNPTRGKSLDVVDDQSAHVRLIQS